ncbi:MAG: AAA family ATPase, partial [Actinobacteria bacterium]|nr:AAA family ATPase [Actinomycetota bacterium]
MLEEVRISGLGVIDEAVLELSPGFNVVTGETGAGKTMVVSGLGLLFGGRADPARVRPGAARAVVEGRLRVEPGGAVAVQVGEAGADLDDEGSTLILVRTVSAEGRSRATAGGRSVPVSLLTALADDLVAVHGQADQQQLLKPGRQRAALDRFSGPEFAELLASYQLAYHRHAQVRAELEELTTSSANRAREAEDLRSGLAEIDRVEPAEGEDIELMAEDERLSNADALHAAATTAHEVLAGEPSSGSYEAADVASLLAAARSALDSSAHHDPVLAGLAGRVAEAAYLIADVAADLASYIQTVEADPQRLAFVQERRAELTRLVRNYGAGGAGEGSAGDLAAVLAWAKGAGTRLLELDAADDNIGTLAAQETELAETVARLAAQLTAARTETAVRFAEQVTAELTALAMPHAQISVA